MVTLMERKNVLDSVYMHTYRSNIFASFRSTFKDCNLVISVLYVRNILSITHRIVDFDYFFINIVMAPNLMEEIAKKPFDS